MAELLYRFWQHKSQRARRQPLPSSLTESLLVSYWTLARKVASAKRRIVFSVILWRLTMRPADAYRLKYRSDGTASQTIDPEIEPTNVDSLPDELLAHILSPVDLKSLVQARAVCKS